MPPSAKWSFWALVQPPKNVVDGEKFDLGERFFVFPGDFWIARTIGIACGNFLTFLGIPISQIGFGHGPRAFFIGNCIDDGERRLRQDRERRRDDLELVLAELALRQERFVFPGKQDIANTALDKGDG